jgi:hypothetical protein
MMRSVFPGGLYVSALPGWAYAVLYPNQRIDTHAGDLPMPPGEAYGPMFLDVTRTPEFKVCGLAHDANGVQWEWSQTRGWQRLPFLTGRGAYDKFGNFRDLLPAGVQFVNDAGLPVSRIDTYGPFHGLSEWSETAGLYIGQGHELSGVQVWDGQNLRTLDTGYCVFIRVHRDGEAVAVSYHRDGSAVIVQTTLAELRALPLAHVPHPPEPPDSPEEPTMEYPLPDRVYRLVVELAARFPELRRGDDEARRAFTLKVAQQVCFSLSPWWGTKRAGAGRPLSKDAIAFQDDAADPPQLIGWDLIDGTTREVHPHPIMGEDISGQVFVSVDPVNHLGTAPPPPPPAPDAELDAIEARLAALEDRQIALTARLEALERPPVRRRVALRADTGRYVAADHGRGDLLVADRVFLGAWETFELIDVP